MMVKMKKSGKKRSRRGGGEWKWYFAIAACTIIVFGVGWVAMRLIAAGEINETTLCRRDGPLNTTVVLLDLTDPLNRTQQSMLKTILQNEIAASGTDTMVALGVVSESPEKWGARFAKCKPETGENANVLYENPGLIAARYKKEFVEPIWSIMESVITVESENQSPIMEALQSLISETPDFSNTRGRRKLIIVSDMLQHSGTLSFYRGQGWQYFSHTEGDRRLAGNLSGVHVEILRIPRTGPNIPGDEVTEDFWTRYFDRQGSRPPTVRSLGDL